MNLEQTLEKYKESSNKQLVLNSFLDELWKSKCKHKKYKRYYAYNVDKRLLNNRQDLVDLFKKYNKIEYTVCRSFYPREKLNSIDYIRIHINNMYALLFDKDVYYNKKYYQLLKIPKQEYFKAVKKRGNVNYEEVKERIEKALVEAELVKKESIAKKIDMPFKDYKQLINGFIERIFNNYIPIEEYEKKHGWDFKVFVDSWSEDNFIIKYFCKSLTGYMRKYIGKIRGNKYNKIKGCIVRYNVDDIYSKYNTIQLLIGRFLEDDKVLNIDLNDLKNKLTESQIDYINKTEELLKNKDNRTKLIVLNNRNVPTINLRQLAIMLHKDRSTVYGVIRYIYKGIFGHFPKQSYSTNNVKYDFDYVKQYIESKGCELLSNEYSNNKTRLIIRCACGNIFTTNFDGFKNKHQHRCLECSKYSLGEGKIEKFLRKNKYKYKKQHCFDDLIGVNGKLLRFDFAVFDDNNHVKLLIEYDGEHHFKPIRYNGANKENALIKFQNTLIHDFLKIKYCQNNNIPLLKISFSEIENIDNILYNIDNYKGITYCGEGYEILQQCDSIEDVKNITKIASKIKPKKKYGFCLVCGGYYKRKSNSQKYCALCRTEKERERQKMKWHKYKHKYRSATANQPIDFTRNKAPHNI